MKQQFDQEVEQIEVDQPESVDREIALLEKRIEGFEKVKTFAIKLTTPTDWILYGDHPYLPSYACEKIARILNIEWFGIDGGELRPEKMRHDSGHYTYVVSGKFRIKLGSYQREISVMGKASSQKPFFSKAKGRTVPIEEINESDVMMAAYSNFVVQGVTRLLGIRGITLDDLKQHGLDVAKIEKVDFRTEYSDKMTDEQKEVLAAVDKMLSILANNDPEAKKKMLQQATEWTTQQGEKVPGKSNIKEVTSKQLPYLYRRIRNQFVAYLKSGLETIIRSKQGREDFLKQASTIEKGDEVIPGHANWANFTDEQLFRIYEAINQKVMEAADAGE